MKKTYLSKVELLKKLFSEGISTEERYLVIIDLGKKLEKFLDVHKTTENKIENCQSTTYFRTFLKNNLVQIQASSDALISKGLAALLIYVYNNEKPEIILTCPPHFLKEIGIQNSISLTRINGLMHMYQRLKEDAIKYLKDNK